MPCPTRKFRKSPAASSDKLATAALSPLRPILVGGSPLSPMSPVSASDDDEGLSLTFQSRRSTSSGSDRSVSGKCVHFPPNPAKLTSCHITHSRDTYDRSPIIPSGEDLEMPSCKSAQEGGWIRCLRRKAKEAASQGVAPPHGKEIQVSRTLSVSESDEMLSAEDEGSSTASSCPPSRAASPAPVGRPNEPVPALVFDDCSSSSESDHDHVFGLASPGILSPVDIAATPSKRTTQHARSPSDDFFRSMEIDDDLQVHWKNQPVAGDDYMQGIDDFDGYEEDAESDEEDHHGMCAMGKFSRAEVYQENDAFGGF